MSGEAALDLTIGVPYRVREVGVDGSAGDTPMASIEKITDGALVEMGRVPVSALNGMDLSSDTEAGNYGAIVAASNGDWSTHRVTGGALGQTIGTLSSPATNPQAVGPQTAEKSSPSADESSPSADESSPSANGSDGADKAPTFDRMVMPADAKESLEDLQGKLEDQNDRNWFQRTFGSTTNYDALGDAGDDDWIPSVGSDKAKEAVDKANSTIDGLSENSIDADPAQVSGIGASPMTNMNAAKESLAALSESLTSNGDAAAGMYSAAAGASKGDMSTALTGVSEGMRSVIPEFTDTVAQVGDRVGQAGDARNAIASGFDAVVDQGRVMVQKHMSDLSDTRSSGAVSGMYNAPNFDADAMVKLTSDLDAHIKAVTGQLKTDVVTPMTELSSAAGDIKLNPVTGTLGATAAPEPETAAKDTPAPPTGGSTSGGGSPVRSDGSTGSSSSGSSSSGSSSSGSSSSGKSEDEKRAAAERIADILSGGGAATGAMGTGGVPFDPIQAMQQGLGQMGQMGQTGPSGMDQFGLGTGGMTATTDPYESLLNPATHLTSGFGAGDMDQIRQSMAPTDAASSAAVRPFTQEARTADQMIVSPPAAQSGQAVPRPTALGADMRPLDKDDDGKVDDDAVAATKENMTDEDGNPKEVDSAVMIDGEPHPVTVDDPRLLEMMNIVGSDASADSPVEILDAADKAGVPLSSYGEMLEDPTEAKAGDVIVSSKGNGFYLGDGQVLMENGEVKPIADVLELRPPQSGVFSLELPELPDDVATDDEAQAAADAYASANAPEEDLAEGGASEASPAENVAAEDAPVADSAAGEGDPVDGDPEGGAQGTAGVASDGAAAAESPAAPGGGTPVAEDVPLGGAEEPAAEEPAAEEPAAEEPAAEEPASEEAAASEAEEPADEGAAEEPASEESPKAEAEVSVEFGRDGFHADGSGSIDLDAIGLRDFDGKAVG